MNSQPESHRESQAAARGHRGQSEPLLCYICFMLLPHSAFHIEEPRFMPAVYNRLLYEKNFHAEISFISVILASLARPRRSAADYRFLSRDSHVRQR
jgi:hypothetical protein